MRVQSRLLNKGQTICKFLSSDKNGERSFLPNGTSQTISQPIGRTLAESYWQDNIARTCTRTDPKCLNVYFTHS